MIGLLGCQPLNASVLVTRDSSGLYFPLRSDLCYVADDFIIYFYTLLFVSFPVISVSLNWMMIIQFHDGCIVFIYFVSFFINMSAFPLRCCGFA